MYTVLFVCYHNAGRSQMAEAFFNKLARERSLEMKAISAGTVAARQVNPVVVEAMLKAGCPIEHQRPKQLMQWHVDAADRVITMHCGVDPEHCPARFFESEDWNLDDPAGQTIEIVMRIRDEIEQKVTALVAGIAHTLTPVAG